VFASNGCEVSHNAIQRMSLRCCDSSSTNADVGRGAMGGSPIVSTDKSDMTLALELGLELIVVIAKMSTNGTLWPE